MCYSHKTAQNKIKKEIKTNPDAEVLEGAGRRSEEPQGRDPGAQGRHRRGSPGKDGLLAAAASWGPRYCNLLQHPPCLGGEIIKTEANKQT